MLALRVRINDKESIVAGADDLSVLSAMVTLTGKLGRNAVDPGRGKPDMFLGVVGLTARAGRREDEHLRWTPHVKLKVGDRVLVELVEVTKSDRIVERRSAGRKSSDEHKYYRQLKKQYLELKKKYEPET